MMLDAAIVGLGGWGQVLCRAVQGRSERIRFVRGVTRTPAKATEFARQVDIPVDDDYLAALADKRVQAVVLATPHSQHVEQVVAAATAGKHVFVEKPLALSRKAAEAAFSACRKAGVVLAVGHNRRFLPAYKQLRHHVMTGAYGPVLHIEANFSGPSGYRRAPGSWRTRRDESPAGGMTGKGIHMTDLMIDLMGPPVTAYSRSFRQLVDGDTDDTTLVLLDFTTGATAQLTTLTATADVWRFQVFCANAWLEIREQHRLTIQHLDGRTDIMEFAPVDIERAELEAFAAAVAGEQGYPVEERQALANVALLETIANATSDRQEAAPVEMS